MDSVWFNWSTVGTFYADFASGKNQVISEKGLEVPCKSSSSFD